MFKTLLAASATFLVVTAAIAGDRTADANAPANTIFFSGGIPALEIRSNRSNTACIFEERKSAAAKPAKAVFAVY